MISFDIFRIWAGGYSTWECSIVCGASYHVWDLPSVIICDDVAKDPSDCPSPLTSAKSYFSESRYSARYVPANIPWPMTVTGGVQKIPLGCVWGSSPTQIGSHIHLNLNRVQGVWQSSGDAVDGHMEHHHLITTTLGTADLKCELKLLVTGGTWKISICCDWGWSPTHIGSHHS